MTREEFEQFFNENYKAIGYEDIREKYEAFVVEQKGKIFHEDYQLAGKFTKNDFMENLSNDAKFFFQDTLTELFYDKNPEVYETAFAIFEENEGKKTTVTSLFDETYHELYVSFLNQLFDDKIA